MPEKSDDSDAFTSPSSSSRSVCIRDRFVTDEVIVFIFDWRSWLFWFIFSLRAFLVSFNIDSVSWILASILMNMIIWEAMMIKRFMNMMCFDFIFFRFCFFI